MDDRLHIVVVGKPRTGKTTMALYLAEILQEAGFDITFIPDMWEVPTHVDKVRSELPERLKELRQTRSITVEQKAARKDGSIIGE